MGCGGITKHHLTAYQNAGLSVTAFCDIDRGRAKQQRDLYFPDAQVFDDYQDLLRDDEIEVVDIATHPPQRLAIIEAALRAGKHVLSQKPFVLDLAEGQRLVEIAEQKGVKLAVNQNGRWAPHYSYLRLAVRAGLVGEISSAHLSVHWDHSWVQGTVFEAVHHLILYDFAIHWFDLLSCFFGDRLPKRVYASTARSATQPVEPPLLAQALIEYDQGQACLLFDAFRRGWKPGSCHRWHEWKKLLGKRS